MFALIISIIAIALVVALAGATLYYGGDAFTQGAARSSAAALVNQGQQIAGAWTLAEAENGGAAPADLAALVSAGFLAAVPTSPVTDTWALSAGNTAIEVTGPSLSKEICDQVNRMPGAGTAGVFQCTETGGVNTFTYDL
jgi:hypothetical protein